MVVLLSLFTPPTGGWNFFQRRYFPLSIIAIPGVCKILPLQARFLDSSFIEKFGADWF
jgi:hypothetical protein